MKRNKTTRSILAMVLTLAMLLTGVSLDGAMTAKAADSKFVLINLKDNTELENETVTMKPGDEMTFQYTLVTSYGSKSNKTDNYDWESSDESVASILKEYTPDITGDNPELWDVRVRAEKEGTATITGTQKKTGKTLSFTVVVKAAKETKKQKSCKHVWKTTRKATCVRNGVKTCKKCKLTKVIKQKEHKFVTKTETDLVYKTYPIYVCQACACEGNIHPYGFFDGCDNTCGEDFDAKDYDTNHNGFDVNDINASYEAYKQHQRENNHLTGSLSERVGYADPQEVTTKVTRCKSCGQTKEQIKNAGQ